MAREIWKKGLREGWEEINRVLYRKGLLYLPEIIRTELINRHQDDQLAGYFGVKKTRELVAQKYYWSTLRADIKAYVKGYDICITSKAVRYKPYGNLQSLPLPIHCWKDLSIDFVTGLLVSTNWKGETYESILVIVDRRTKMVHYKPVKVIIDAHGLVNVIIDVIVLYRGLSDSIISD